MLSKAEAASYCGLGARRFEAECPVRPVELPGGARVFDMVDLDKWIDTIKGAAEDDTAAIIARLG
ncbi:MAG: hypothetical protein KDK07_25600 [Bauldia sp.]|nr:hypothetical protein [Bauldia sp.]